MPNSPRAEPALDAASSAALNELLTLDHAAIAAYSAAIPLLVNIGRRQTLMRFRDDHQRHVEELSGLLRGHGGTPVDPPAAGEPRTNPPAGGDRDLMAGLARVARRTQSQYARATRQATGWPEPVMERLAAAAAETQRHRQWAEEQLAQLGGGVSSAPQRVAAAVDDLRARVGPIGPRIAALRPSRPSKRTLAVGAAALAVSLAVTVSLTRRGRRRR
jgi:hypothetical protein